MVTRSDYNYEQHKEDIKLLINEKLGSPNGDRFIKFYSERYDIQGRSFIDWHLALVLVKEWLDCKNLGTRWYAFVGVGGTGKSTLAKNVFYFLDPTFNIYRSSNDLKGFIKIIGGFGEEDKLKAAYMDEPDDSVASHSEKGKQARKIFGKIRQQNAFLGICATDLTDIPPYIFRKLSGVFFTPKLGKGMFFRNDPEKKSYLLQEIRKNYQVKGYKIFFELQKRVGSVLFDTSKYTPLDSQESEYLKLKRKDYENDIKEFLVEKREKTDDKTKLIVSMKESGMTQQEIADIVGVSRARIGQILGKVANASGEHIITMG